MAVAPASIDTDLRPTKPPRTFRQTLLIVFLAATALVWLSPILAAIYTSLRPFEETAAKGYFSLPDTLNFNNYVTAWTQADLLQYFLNTLYVTVPAVLVTLFLSSLIAFGLSRYNLKFNVFMLLLVTAGNLLPQQTLITPLYRMFLSIPLPTWLSETGIMYDSYFGIIVIHVAFQMGFCAFVMSNYMKTLSHELTEAAVIDGAGVWRQYWSIILPLLKPVMAALGTLQFTWIYNDFFWARVLMGSGDKRPITSALDSLQGLYFTDPNLISAGSVMAAIPTLIVFLLLSKQFVSGLTLGSSKG